MQESHSQSDMKLPPIEDHSGHRLPIRMNPSYRLKYTNPIRIGYLRYLDRRSLDERIGESFYLENYAKSEKVPFKESHKYETRRMQQLPPREKKVEQYHKPQLRYFDPNDSDVDQRDVEKILNLRDFKQVGLQYKVFLSE